MLPETTRVLQLFPVHCLLRSPRTAVLLISCTVHCSTERGGASRERELKIVQQVFLLIFWTFLPPVLYSTVFGAPCAHAMRAEALAASVPRLRGRNLNFMEGRGITDNAQYFAAWEMPQLS